MSRMEQNMLVPALETRVFVRSSLAQTLKIIESLPIYHNFSGDLNRSGFVAIEGCVFG